jgi:hypothetical protein
MMVMARLHIICGNCGCNDMWEWEHKPKIDGEDGEIIDDEDVYLSCRNCATLHSINDNAKNRRKTKDN